MSDITQLVARNLSIARNSLAAAQSALDTLYEVFGDTQVMDGVVPAGCGHPAEQREDRTTMGMPAGSHWVCRRCGYEYREEAADAE